jgi:hydroxymethylglutaryl-CoA reductase (NADPH)
VAAPRNYAKDILARTLGGKAPEVRAAELRPRLPSREPLPPHLPAGSVHTAEAVEKRRRLLAAQGLDTARLAGAGAEPRPEDLAGNIENLVGFARVPVGVIGPLRINGANARGDFYVPLATSEGALVASCHRGACAVSQAGGVTALCLTESVSRAPCFVFDGVVEAGRFLSWALPRVDSLQEIVARTSGHCRLLDVKTALSGKEVHLIFEFSTGDAAGQNMVTLAAEAICREFAANSPVAPRRWYVEGNMSGDKKASMMSFTFARGKSVVAEAVIPAKILKRFVHAAPEDLVRYWQVSMLGGVQSGSIGVQGHYANALAALFIACGQDAACVAEAAVGLTRMDVTDGGDLYVSVKLPSLTVGTVGGGTALPTARECLEMLGCYGQGRARKFAEICAATVLAGEVSIIGSMAAGDFARAHQEHGRKGTGEDKAGR